MPRLIKMVQGVLEEIHVPTFSLPALLRDHMAVSSAVKVSVGTDVVLVNFTTTDTTYIGQRSDWGTLGADDVLIPYIGERGDWTKGDTSYHLVP